MGAGAGRYQPERRGAWVDEFSEVGELVLLAGDAGPSQAAFGKTDGTAGGEAEDYMVLVKQNEGLDFGDAPDPGHPTWSGSVGAVHSSASGIYLGCGVDWDFDGHADPSGGGDDKDGTDDEGGVRLLTRIVPGKHRMAGSDRFRGRPS